MPNLIDIIAKVNDLDAEDIVFVKPDWRPDSEAKIFRLTIDCRIPEEAKSLGYSYFLEVDVIRQVLEEFHDRPNVTLEEKCARIIQYAIYDA